MARKLRIAVSVFFGVLAVVLSALWVRSYSKYEGITLNQAARINELAYLSGALSIYSQREIVPPDYRGVSVFSESKGALNGFVSNFVWTVSAGRTWIVFPFWAPLSLVLGIAIAPWLCHSSPQFSLRALLIAATLIAVVLGLVVWAAR